MARHRRQNHNRASQFPKRWRRLIIATTLASIIGIATISATIARAANLDSPPLSPPESLAAIELTDGFVAELVAAEPLVMDPVAIDWGPDGKLWVAEMADYPLGIFGNGKPGGRIRFLEDTNGDGKYDRSTLFLDNVSFPNGVMAYKRGVLVTAAPEIFYAEDTDGDGQADHRETLYSGFVAANQQLRVNGLRYGLDNWIHCASGAHNPNFGKDRDIRSEKLDKTISLGSRDFRIRPDTGELAPQSGPSQFGRDRDDGGNWFGVQNAHPLWHYALGDHYVRRNPHFAAPDARVEVIVGDAPRIYSAKAPQKRFHSFHLANRFTSACGISIYRDELLYPRGQEQHSFTCAPFHNLVHHAVLTRDGVTFRGRRADNEQRSELFASRDRWCRPVMTRTGPDGALWVVDMYRYLIEHPQFLSDTGRKELKPHYRAGDKRGRIYRVYHRDRPPRAWSRLDTMTTDQQVAALSHPNGIVRDLAQRRLIEQPDDAAEQIASAFRMSTAIGRLHALCTLDGLGQLDDELLAVALQDKDQAVRRHAVRIAEPQIAKPGPVHDAFMALARRHDTDAQVRQQVAYALGSLGSSDAAPLLIDNLLREDPDPHMTAAYLSSIRADNIEAAIARLLATSGQTRHPTFERTLLKMALMYGVDRPATDALAAALSRDSMSATDIRRVAAILDGYVRRGDNPWTSLPADTASRLEQRIVEELPAVLDEGVSAARRSDLATLLFRIERRQTSDLETSRLLLNARTPVTIQKTVIHRMAASEHSDVAAQLFTQWKELSPIARDEILSYTVSRPVWVASLLDAVEHGGVPPSDIDAALRQTLRWHSDLTLRGRVRRTLESVNENRQAVLVQYEPALELPGDANGGREVFKDKCATCHRDDGIGHKVGPQLAAITDRTPRGLLTSILDPNRAVESKFINYTAITSDGRSYSGILAAETSTAIALREADAKEHVILRRDLEELQSTGRSLMPEGLEKDISAQDMADVIAFIRRPRPAESQESDGN